MPNVLTNGMVFIHKSACMYGNQLGLNVRHFRVTNVVGTPTDDDVVNDLYAACAAAYPPLMPAVASFYGNLVQIIKPVPLVPIDNVAPVAGTVAGDIMPSQVSGIIKLKTNFAGRANRGRIYVPFPGVHDLDSATDHPTGAYQGNLNTLAAVLGGTRSVGGGGNTAQIIPVIFHKDSGTTTDITSAEGILRWATQRRRGDYGRPNLPPW